MTPIETLASCLLEGDPDKAWACIENYPETSRPDLYHHLLTPAMRHIGHLWETNKITVADEHLATATCDFILSKLAFSIGKERSGGKAMFLCLDGEQHYLGLKMVDSLFREQGWETRYFGPSLPLEYALQTAESWKPDIIGLSVSIVYHLPRLQQYVEAFSQLQKKPAILLGGRLTGMYDLRPHCTEDTVILGDLPETERWLQNFMTGGQQSGTTESIPSPPVFEC
ncbi:MULTISPECIES: cobalamin B12-binding domain-containing protein [Bhargavaea]|uniref:B12-binding domain-containing protein n=1 Tax=Bhargavaea changchunensis TaxID=2134037 RepID=A0ABW2NF80_9BACL|nr:cobalamin B12-binding domain-containing protein [Bhargavaea sp. CC-171006]